MDVTLTEDDIEGVLGLFEDGPVPAATAVVAAPAPDYPRFTDAELLRGLVGGALVYYRPDFLRAPLADRCFDALRPGGAAGVAWERRKIRMYGREVTEGRATAFFGDPGTSYRYSGKNHVPDPWSADPTGALAEILDAARRATGKPYNFVLCNWYEPGDSIGPHSDDERDLVAESGIFSVSLGCARLFHLDPKTGAGAGGRPLAQRLAHGSAIWMAGLTQVAYKHRVDAEKIVAGPANRVNLTFRCVRVRY